MWKVLIERIKQGYQTKVFPKGFELPEKFKGRPRLENKRCKKDCLVCLSACPVGAISKKEQGIVIDLGLCIFCGACENICPADVIFFSRDYKLAVSEREHLLINNTEYELAKELNKKCLSLFGRSLKLRQVSAGGCNACEADSSVLQTLAWDLSRFGIGFTASPRHADGLLITGPVTANMKTALWKTWQALPDPRLVIVVGACAISGGIYKGHSQCGNGVEQIPVDLYVPGCPPHPAVILDGLLRLLGRLPKKGGRS
jgi:Ni,Fe-hydrogenase III small subunit/ferredoxin